MKFAIRDDDISYFSNPGFIKRIYKGIWETVPISFAVIPFIHGSVRIVPEAYKKDRVYPVAENTLLVRLLKKKIREGTASIMLHGYSHEKGKRGEFYTDSDLYQKVKEGKEYLESTFDTRIKNFVAPNHAISKKGMDAVIKNKLNIVGSPGLKDRPIFWKWKHVKNITKTLFFRLFHESTIRYPYPLDFGTHKELYSYGIVESTKEDDIKRGMDFSSKNDGVFCITIHTSAFCRNNQLILDRRHEMLKNIVEKSRTLDAEYVSIDDVL